MKNTQNNTDYLVGVLFGRHYMGNPRDADKIRQVWFI